MKIPLYTPWGAPQKSTVIRPGVIQLSTESHGGIYVHTELNELIPPQMKLQMFSHEHANEGWYEEDQDAGKVLKYLDQHPEVYEYVQLADDPQFIGIAEITDKNFATPGFDEAIRKSMRQMIYETAAKTASYKAIKELNQSLVFRLGNQMKAQRPFSKEELILLQHITRQYIAGKGEEISTNIQDLMTKLESLAVDP